MNTRISEVIANIPGRALRSGQMLALLVLATFTSLMPARAQAQSADTWKSVAIIGGSTAAGAIIGHKVGGRHTDKNNSDGERKGCGEIRSLSWLEYWEKSAQSAAAEPMSFW